MLIQAILTCTELMSVASEIDDCHPITQPYFRLHFFRNTAIPHIQLHAQVHNLHDHTRDVIKEEIKLSLYPIRL
jgi:hypothetical protein